MGKGICYHVKSPNAGLRKRIIMLNRRGLSLALNRERKENSKSTVAKLGPPDPNLIGWRRVRKGQKRKANANGDGQKKATHQ